MRKRELRQTAFMALLIIVSIAVTGCRIGNFTFGVSMKSGSNQPGADSARLKSVILLRKGSGTYGAFIPLAYEKGGSECVKYEWYYRADGKGTFKRSDAAEYKAGIGVTKGERGFPWNTARFGPFALGWSLNDDKSGWLYYPKWYDEDSSKEEVRVCVTREKDLEKIDARDNKWIYKVTHTDSGIRANGMKVKKR